ncbi:hypothetical protein ILUMI_06798 [Ignelater luminosus]|uniref:DDE Tnp4 domain-containing protein n=1 Tax=Ignelater luminosus TaxID=2038154 RepID=A0A8K0D9I9_IGNLU|nr:hypothetical protein ILUMI_06798 [Ignelater luminosus]
MKLRCGLALRSLKNRSQREALFMLLMVLTKNVTRDIVGGAFEMKQSLVSRSIESATMTRLSQFVPNNLGCQHKTRIQIQNHTVPVFNEVFGQPPTSVPIVFDCTYVYIEKPQDHELQKKTWSVHKNSNLYKVMIRCLSDGYILVADGQYFADENNNDATILKLMLKKPLMLSFFQPRDYVVVDRGFRDVLDETKSHGIEVYMPNLLKHEKQ